MRILPALVAAAALAVLTGCSSLTPADLVAAPPSFSSDSPAPTPNPRAPSVSPSPVSPSPRSTRSLEGGKISVLAVGDSLAAGDGHDDVPTDPGSWRMYLQEPLEVTGGWWRDGALTQGMADYLDPATADALVVMGGTNDIIRGIPKQATLANIARIVGEVDVDLVAICAVPPWSGSPPASSALNAALAQQADQNGWIFVDPWAEYRSGDTWAAGGSPDGVHGSAAAYEAAGRAITEAVEDGLG